MESADLSTTTRPIIIGHRGASGHALENSLAAFSIAADPAHPGHCDGVELDIHVTTDGKIVVHHDPYLSTGEAIAATSLVGVRAVPLADGSSIPLLDEVIDILSGVELFVEAKGLPAAADPLLAAALARHRGAKAHVHAFDHRIIARLHSRFPRLSLGVLSSSVPVDVAGQVRRAGAQVLWQEHSLIDADLMASCRSEGIAVIAWTVNEQAEAGRLSELGVTGLCGNWPERLRRS